MATECWEDFSGRHSDSGVVVAINGGEELAGVHGEAPTGHVTTRSRHRERERSTGNSPVGFPMSVRLPGWRSMAAGEHELSEIKNVAATRSQG
jgi:hypothetical protein